MRARAASGASSPVAGLIEAAPLTGGRPDFEIVQAVKTIPLRYHRVTDGYALVVTS
jgi:hypothetical protein